jgi:hypothetical protein
MTTKTLMICVATIAGIASAAAQTKGLPGPLPAPTIYSAPTPAPMAPLINPGPAVAPPAGVPPLLTQPVPTNAHTTQAMPAYPSPQFPGPTGQQNMQSNRSNVLDQQWQLERSGVSPGSERSREIQQQLNQPGSR